MLRSELKRRTACLLFSLIIHALFAYMLFNYRFTIKIYPKKLEVREVFIASPEKLYIPEDIENLIVSSPEIELEIIKKLSAREWRLKSKSETPLNKNPGLETDTGQSFNTINNKNIKNEAEAKEFKTGLFSGFGLNLPSKFELDLPADYKLDLSLSSRKTKNTSGEKGKGNRKRNINLLKYPYPNFSNVFPSKIKRTSGSYGFGSSNQHGRASFKAEGYDITPWAEKVVNRIQKNWNIPFAFAQKMSAKGVVGISVIIEKNGMLSSAKIVFTSMVLLFDEAALEALKLASPFPDLPADFP
ncbi:TonB C-terminal domain-containing protein, partial [bacterium]|nr:TonB C-terminal domain-containing protein [bacterium]